MYIQTLSFVIQKLNGAQLVHFVGNGLRAVPYKKSDIVTEKKTGSLKRFHLNISP